MLIKDKKSQFAMLAGKLDALSPLKVLERGYSVVKSSEGNIVSRLEQVSIGDALEVSLKDGKIDCKVVEMKQGGNLNG